MAVAKRSRTLTLAGSSGQPPRALGAPPHLNVANWTRRLSYAGTQFPIPDGSGNIEVTLESWTRSSLDPTVASDPRRVVSVDVRSKNGPDGEEDGGVPVNVWPNDLPALIVSLIKATMMAERDAVIPALDPTGHAILEKLYAVLPAEE